MNLKEYWADHHINDVAIAFLRAFTGLALLAKGVYFMFNTHVFYSYTSNSVPLPDFMLYHFVVFAHVVGGFCLFLGLMTKLVAAINVPVILGAIIFVHSKEGLFTSGQGLELTVMLLFVLSAIALTGSKFLSIDGAIEKLNEEQMKQELKEHKKQAGPHAA